MQLARQDLGARAYHVQEAGVDTCSDDAEGGGGRRQKSRWTAAAAAVRNVMRYGCSSIDGTNWFLATYLHTLPTCTLPRADGVTRRASKQASKRVKPTMGHATKSALERHVGKW